MCFMKCLEFEQSVRELARHQLFGELPDGLWEASVRAQALTHAEECAACASRLADARRLSAGLCVLAASEQKLGAPARVEAALLTAFRQQPPLTAAPMPATVLPFTPRRRQWTRWALAAAATLLLGLFAYALRPERPAADQTSALVTASPTPAPEAPMNAPPAPELVKQASPPKLMAVKAMHRAPHARIERYLVESEIATDFLPLTENAPPPNPAGLQTVRVEVPRLMLTRFGLPVNFERVTEPVKADLLIGPDGQTRAIRFVQTDFETPQIISASTNKER